MGIQNLLPFVKKACRQGNVREVAGHSVAVDVSCLLHRGLFGCASEVAQGLETDFYVKYVAKYVKVLISLGCHVILVFDGKALPAKKDTNDARRERRHFNKSKGDQLLSEGKINEAHDFFKRCVTITAEVVGKTIEALRELPMVDVLVAPYESDAQLAFLTKTNKAYAVITEDSDLIAFGCERIIFKLNHKDGSCIFYERDKLHKCFQGTLAINFDFTKFRRICILAGCDYLQSGLPGIGLSKATTFFSKASGWDLRQLLPRLPRYLNMKSIKVKKEFIEDFIRAENTFLYQIVYDTSERRQRPLNDYPIKEIDGVADCDEDDFVGLTMADHSNSIDYSYAGEVQSASEAIRLALGNKLDGGSLMTDKFVLPNEPPEWSIWSPQFKSGAQRMLIRKNKEKTLCGAFTLSSSIRKREDIPEEGSGSTSNMNCSEENNETVISDSRKIKCLDDDDDFISTIKSFSRTEKTGRTRSQLSEDEQKSTMQNSRRSGRKITSIGVSPRGNGAIKNWDCEELLELYKRGGEVRSSGFLQVSTKKSPVDNNSRSAVKRSVCTLGDRNLIISEKRSKADDGSGIRSTVNSVEGKVKTSYDAKASDTQQLKAYEVGQIGGKTDDARNLTSCYFANRNNVRTSGLSRRVSNPFKKVLLKREDNSSACDSNHTQDLCSCVAIDNDPSDVPLSVGSTTYRPSGLRRIIVKER